MGHHKTVGVMIAAVLAAWLAGCGSSTDGTGSVAAPCPPVTAAAAPVAATPVPAVKTVKNTKADSPATAKPAAKTDASVQTVSSGKPAATTGTKPASTTTPAKTDDAGAMFAALKAKMDAAGTYAATVHVLDNNKFKVKQTKSTLKITCKAPTNYRIDMVETNNPITQGGKIIFDYGATDAKLRPGGILGMAVLTMALTDTKITTGCEWRLDQVVAKAITERMASYKAELVGQTTVGADTVKILKMTTDGDNTLDKDIDYEQVGLDSNNLLRYWAVYAKQGVNVPNSLMWQMTLDSVELDVPVTAATFVI